MTSIDKLTIYLFQATNNDWMPLLGIIIALVGIGLVIFYNILIGVCVLCILPLGTCLQNYLHSNYIRILKR